ncbi:hypothetical protein ACFC08_00035 [Streptomyces sp. NPDC056112]|uniref:hypothetical protein n=1 Tax=Streptomyces sp. NPDC056112 TaxID=3345715 RepID=UPI0035E1568C
MASFDFPADLLALEATAWQAQQQGALTAKQAADVHEAIGAFAKQAELPRLDVEMGLKRAVRHPEPGAAEG